MSIFSLHSCNPLLIFVLHAATLILISGFIGSPVLICADIIVLCLLWWDSAAPFHGHLFNEASLGQSTNQLYPTIFSFSLASLLRKSITLHSLWFLNSVQHSMPEMFQRVVHILLSFPGVASLVPGYSRAAAASLGMWHLHVTCTSTWAALSSGKFGFLGIVIGYTCSSSV